MKVFSVIHDGKSDRALTLHRSRKEAQAVAIKIILQRANEAWHLQDRKWLEGHASFDSLLAVFHELEQDESYGNRVSISEHDV